MWLLVLVLLTTAFLAVGLLIAIKKSSQAGRCVYATSNAGKYACNCSEGMSESDCSEKAGVYDPSTCAGDFAGICNTKFFGSCLTDRTCTFPTFRADCATGTWSLGDTCQSQVS